jgi:hypothetical protein
MLRRSCTSGFLWCLDEAEAVAEAAAEDEMPVLAGAAVAAQQTGLIQQMPLHRCRSSSSSAFAVAVAVAEAIAARNSGAPLPQENAVAYPACHRSAPLLYTKWCGVSRRESRLWRDTLV